MEYFVHTTKKFDKEVEQLSHDDIRRIENIILQIKENPYVGDQLQIKMFREKRMDEKRIYYLIFEDLHTVLMVAISGKKAQQKVINFIRGNIDVYREYLKKIIS